MNRFVFYPVGQGLFYAGHLWYDPYGYWRRSVLFDCGGDKPYIEDAIDRFEEETMCHRINLCVISHLHKDHYNGLALLKDKGFMIDRLVIPYLPVAYPNLKYVYIVGQYFSGSQNLNIDELDIENLELIFRLYGVHESERNDREFFGQVRSFEENVIENGFKYFKYKDSIPLHNQKKWIFEIYNKTITDEQWREYNDRLNACLREEGIEDVKRLFPDRVEKLIDIYKTVFGKNLNATSIVMKHYCQGLQRGFYPVRDSRVGCFDGLYDVRLPFVFERRVGNVTVLTGDAEFDEYLHRCIFDDVSSISALQVPHHGAKKNWQKMGLPSDADCKLVVSYGLGNKYRHPNCAVVQDILESYNCDLISVTQATQYEYIIETR